MGRTASDTGVRKVRGAGLELDLVEVEPEAVRCDLGERSPGALAHVVRPDRHATAAISTQHGFGLGLEHERRKGSRAHAPPDEQSLVVAQLAGRQRAALPAEAL